MRFGEKPAETIQIHSNERLSGISKEFHTRKNTAYIVEDKLRDYLILSQRIEDVVNSINRIVEYEPDRVTLTGIYYALGRTASRTGGYTKSRWRVQPIDIDMAAEAFENARQNGKFQNAMIVGRQMSAYKLACA
jgi:hypothetical protein